MAVAYSSSMLKEQTQQSFAARYMTTHDEIGRKTTNTELASKSAKPLAGKVRERALRACQRLGAYKCGYG